MDLDSDKTGSDRIRTAPPAATGAFSRAEKPDIRAFGERVKELATKWRFKEKDLYKLISQKGVGISLEVFYKILNGRADGRWRDVFSTIAKIFAEAALKIEGIEPTEEAVEARTVDYERLIFGGHLATELPIQTEDLTSLAFSFEQLSLPVEPTAMADRFLDAMPPTLSDIASGFDIERRVFSQRNGVRETVTEWLTDCTGPLLVSMSGPSGSGKTVIATRLAYECLQQGFQVFRLLPDWMCSDAIGIQIRRVQEARRRPTLFVFDNAGTLTRKGVRPLDVFRTVKGIAAPCVLLFIENWRLFPPVQAVQSQSTAEDTKHFSVLPLTTTELQKLLERMIELETSGRVKEIRCHLSKEKRLAVCSDDRDRLVAAALLIFRYGRRVVDILTDEFNGIDDAAVRHAYVAAIVCAGLGLAVPKALVKRTLSLRGTTQPVDFWTRLSHLTADVDSGVSIRHPRFYQHLAPVAIPSPLDRADLLGELILCADQNANDELEFVLNVFSHPKLISEILKRDKQSIERWISSVERHLIDMPVVSQKAGYVYLGQVANRSLENYEKADSFFNAAIRCDSSFAFAYRQRSWNLMRAGKLQAAEKNAKEAAAVFPDDLKTLSDSAFVLQYCSKDGFRLAGQLFSEASKLETGDTELQNELTKRIERYQGAKNVLQYYPGEVLHDDVLEELKAPWYVWRLRKGLRRALKIALGSSLRNVDVDADEVENVLRTASPVKDAILKALMGATVARLKYEQWYRGYEPIDAPGVERLFVDAAETLKKSHGQSEAFVRTWYGTFLKEVKQDYSAAEREYRRAIKIASEIPGRNGDYPYRNEPMLLNNLALLLMHAARTKRSSAQVLNDAKTLLDAAIEEVIRRQSRFMWPLETLEELKLLRIEIQ